MRVETHPILSFSASPTVRFTFDGNVYEGREGEPVAAALYAAGVKVLGYSRKNGRPRGLYCCIGNCSSCLAIVDGRPNVRLCTEPLREGMTVCTQKGKGGLL